MSEEIYRKIFSKNLNYYMDKRGKTQTDLIRDLGLNKSAVSTWCNGTRLPRMDKVDALAKYFGIKRSDLIEDKPSPSVTAFPAPLPAQIAAQYGEDMRELVETAAALDHDDRVLVRGEVLQMLKAEKYRKEKAGSAR